MTYPCTSSLTQGFLFPLPPPDVSQVFQAAWHLRAALLNGSCPNATGRRSGPSSDPGIGGLSGNQTKLSGLVGLVDFLPPWALCCSPHPFPLGPSSLPTWDRLAHLLLTLPLYFGSTPHIRDPIPNSAPSQALGQPQFWSAEKSGRQGRAASHSLPQVLIPGQFLTCALCWLFSFAYPRSILHSSCSEPRANSYGMPQPGR